MIPEEPSVLDYVRAKIREWRQRLFGFAGAETARLPETTPVAPAAPQPELPQPAGEKASRPWLGVLALGLALAAQLSLEPRPNRTWAAGVILYALAALAAWAAYRRGEWQPAPPPDESEEPPRFYFNSKALFVGLFFGALAFLAFGGNQFNAFNVSLWGAALVGVILAFIESGAIWRAAGSALSLLQKPAWTARLTRWSLIVLAALGVGIFFRVYLLNEVPSQMVSDHAEKLWDIKELLEGQTRIYFPRNTGREFFQMYLTAGVIRLFHTGLTFLSLKLGTVLCGIFTLPFIYKIGKEVANRQAGLMAMFFAGISYWHNLISRIALRFTLYPFFYALTIYYFLRGLNTRKMPYFLAAGFFLGLGLHGYSPFRVVPLLIGAACLLYLAHTAAPEKRKSALFGLAAAGAIAFVIFLPLLRYSLENPAMFWYRALTRLAEVERPIPGNPALIFLQNLWNGLTMFAWDNGEVWVISVVHRPILDFVAAALFYLGAALILIRYLKHRNWHDLYLLLSIPVLMLPSILSIAYPRENPSLNRTAGALVPVFVVIGISLEGLLRPLYQRMAGRLGKAGVIALGLALAVLSMAQNYDLVFNQYARVYELSSWNSSEMGAVVQDFSELHGSPETAWLVASPHWVDSRLVMINAGYAGQDNPIWPKDLPATVADARPKLFIIRHNPRPEDQAEEKQVLNTLQLLYPAGWAELYPSKYPTKDFWLFFVPPANPGIQNAEPPIESQIP